MKQVPSGRFRGVAQVTALVCDAQLLFAESLSSVLRTRFDITIPEVNPQEAGEAIEAAHSFSPDVVMLDYWLPGQDPMLTVRSILKTSPNTKVILLSSLFHPGHIEQALQTGAAGFLPRTVNVARIAEAIRRAHAGEVPVFREQLEKLSRTLEDHRADSERDLRRVLSLTDRERTVLELLTMGFSVQRIADQMFIAKTTANNHIHRILQKTGASTREEAVIIARASGYAAPAPSTQDFEGENRPE